MPHWVQTHLHRPESMKNAVLASSRHRHAWHALRLGLAVGTIALSTALHAQTQWLDKLGQSDPVSAQLIAHAPQGIARGHDFWVGLKLTHHGEWHTYWQNPGDSGLPTRLQWTLPAGLTAGDIVWPLPKKFPLGPLTNYGYDGTILLLVPVQIGNDFKPAADGQLSIGMKADLLVCSNVCVPQEVSKTIALPVAGATVTHGTLVASALQAAPSALPGAHRVELADQGRTLVVRVERPPGDWQGQTLSLFPITPHVASNSAVQNKDWTQTWTGGTWIARMPVASDRTGSPERMRWLIARGAETSPRGPALELEAPVSGRWPPPPTVVSAHAAEVPAAASSPSAAGTPAIAPTSPTEWHAAFVLTLLAALAGGLLLNLMPCVFPVLALKLLAIAREPGTLRQHRTMGLAYSGGVLLTFVVLGALMLALRAAGQQLGWGFQLQSPPVVTALALLFTLIGLNLAGVFEFGRLLPAGIASHQMRHPVMNSALSGLLAGIVASPCTAPFMGAAIGLAVTLPTVQALLVFMALGLGMAAPVLLVCAWPALAHRLPTPGPWLQTFRKAMAFPMFATVLWLLWVLGRQTDVDTVIALLAAALAVSLLAWALTLGGMGRWLGGALAVGALVAVGSTAGPWGDTDPSRPLSSAPSSRWIAWSEAEVQARLSSGQPVFVDFTAAWCVTCQYNKLTVLSDDGVMAAFDKRRVVTMRADWTRHDPRITQALAALGRSGVPVYVVYASGRPPVVLSEVLTREEVVRVLDSL